ncbi:hypothetical protein KBB85_05925 [Patescibacteria group bacterium]|nr:hypothetical protein [Patescibacteria group bacterium]
MGEFRPQSLGETVEMSEGLEVVAQVEIGDTRLVVVDGCKIELGGKDTFTFIRIKEMPRHAFLIGASPVEDCAGACFSPTLLTRAFRDNTFLKNFNLPDAMPRFPLFSMPTCKLCALGIKHSRRCAEDRQRVIEDAAEDAGISRIITADFTHEARWWDYNPAQSSKVLFLCARSALNPLRGCDSDFPRGCDHRPVALQRVAQHFRY